MAKYKLGYNSIYLTLCNLLEKFPLDRVELMPLIYHDRYDHYRVRHQASYKKDLDHL